MWLYEKLVLELLGCECNSCTATLMDLHTSDHLGDGCYQQNSDQFKPWKPVATSQGVSCSSFPIPPFRHTFFPSYLEAVGSNPETQKNISRQIYYEKIIPNKFFFSKKTGFF